MTDVLDADQRRRCMAAIRGENTLPERIVRSLVHRLGYRFRLHGRHLPGRPDLVLARLRTVIFVHGCFWHRHPGCRFTTTPRTRADFWRAKFEANMSRDARVAARLRADDWHVVTIWECETRDPPRLRRRISAILRRAERRVASGARGVDNRNLNAPIEQSRRSQPPPNGKGTNSHPLPRS